MGQLQLLLLSFEQNIPGCTVLLLSLPRLTASPFQLKNLRNAGMRYYVGREKQQCKKYCSFFLKKFTVLWYHGTKKELHLHPFLYSGHWLWVGRTDTKKLHCLAHGEKRFCVLVPSWKSTTWFKLCLAGSNFIYIGCLAVCFFFTLSS